MKTCKKCGELKQVNQFTASPSTKDKLRNWCKHCFAEYDKYRRATLTSEYKTGRALVRYWPDSTPLEALEKYLNLFKLQGGVCKICKKVAAVRNRFTKNKRLNVDHCHVTGRVRGLLCENCNVGIGLFEDNPAMLDSASAYLKEQ